MKLLPIILAALSFFSAQQAWAEDAIEVYSACESQSAIPVHVHPRFDAPKYEFRVGIRDVVAMSSDSVHAIHEGLSLGLTRYEPMIAIDAPLVGVRKPNGVSCTYVQKADVTVGYENVVIYVAREVPKNSCGFQQIIEHEQKHINVNMRLLQDNIPRITEELNTYLAANGVSHEADVEHAMGVIKSQLHETVEHILEDISRENELRQQEIDNPVEYARITTSCNGQLGQIAAAYAHEHPN